MDIEAIYGAYLKQQELLRERDKNVFHASTAGSCYRKQLYSYFDYPRDSKDSKSYRILRLGTIVHEDIEKALKHYDMPSDRESHVFSEDEIGREAREKDEEYKCNGCLGEGKRDNFGTHYPFESEEVIRFAEFCKESGGFEIC